VPLPPPGLERDVHRLDRIAVAIDRHDGRAPGLVVDVHEVAVEEVVAAGYERRGVDGGGVVPASNVPRASKAVGSGSLIGSSPSRASRPSRFRVYARRAGEVATLRAYGTE